MPLLSNGERRISLCFIEDLVKCVIDAAENPKTSGKIYFVSDGKIYSWVNFADMIIKVMDVKARKINISEQMFFKIAFFMECINSFKKTPHTFDRQKAVVLSKDWACDIARIKKDIVYNPQYTLEAGLKKTVDWYREQGWL